MSDREIERLVTHQFPWLAERQLSVTVLDDYPELKYVTILDDHGEPLIGGPAYVVSLEARQVVKVSGSRPPKANLEDALQQLSDLA